MRRRQRILGAFVAAAAFVCLAIQARAEEIRVMTSGAFTEPYLQLRTVFERETRQRVVTVTTTMGVGAESIPSRLQRGEPADVVIVNAAALDELIRGGQVVVGSRVDLARSAIGMAMRAGATKPDISSTESFKRALLQAKSIAYSASVSGEYFSTELLQRLGIADAVLPKSRRIERERVGAVVARGDAELGLQQISELMPVPGIEVIGPLPQEVQRITVFSAGVASGSRQPEIARAFIAFLSSAAARDTVVRSGLEPVNAR